MKVIAFMNVKGGVGKTSSAVTIAHMLAVQYHKKVLIVDLDPQSNTTDFFNFFGQEPSIEDLLKSKNTVSIRDVIVHTAFKNLDLVPANYSLGGAEKILISDTTMPQQFRLKSQLQKITDEYDYVILDCSPAADSLINVNGLAVADAVFVPLKCDKWATRGLLATQEVIDTVSTYNDRLFFAGCYFVQWENRNVNKAILEDLKQALGDKMLDIKIRKNKDVEEMTYTGSPLLSVSPKGTATQDYLSLSEYIINIMERG